MKDFVKRARTPIEHLFNNHEWCDPEWCWAKSLNEKQEKMMSHVRESHKQNLLVCTPCDDKLVAGTTVINGGATTMDEGNNGNREDSRDKASANPNSPAHESITHILPTPILPSTVLHTNPSSSSKILFY